MLWNPSHAVSKGKYYYAVVPGHPKAVRSDYVLLHRIIVECYLGRLLTDAEVVHHINDLKKDNRIDNLALMSRKEHTALHSSEFGRLVVDIECPYCGMVFTRERRKTHLAITGQKFTCCSRSCSARLPHAIKRGEAVCLRQPSSTVIREYHDGEDLEDVPSVLETHSGVVGVDNLSILWDMETQLSKGMSRRMDVDDNRSAPSYWKLCESCNGTYETPLLLSRYCSMDCSRIGSRRVARPPKEELEILVWERPTSKLAQEFGVSDVAVRKWCTQYGIEKPPRGYWSKVKAGKITPRS